MVKPSMNSPKYLPNVIIRRFMLQIYKRFQYIETPLAKYLYTFYLFVILCFRLELRVIPDKQPDNRTQFVEDRGKQTHIVLM